MDTVLLRNITSDNNLMSLLMKVRPVTLKRDEFEVAGEAQEIVYNYFNYWSMRPCRLFTALENTDYLKLLQKLEIINLNKGL